MEGGGRDFGTAKLNASPICQVRAAINEALSAMSKPIAEKLRAGHISAHRADVRGHEK